MLCVFLKVRRIPVLLARFERVSMFEGNYYPVNFIKGSEGAFVTHRNIKYDGWKRSS